MEELADGITLYHADCLEALKTLPDNSIDSVVCDPPYGIKFMGKSWDHGVPGVPYWSAALRVLKPGGYLLAFSGTRTYHRMACAIEDAGFEVRDMVSWVYGSGFPKSHDVSKGIDKAAGAEREIIGKHPGPAGSIGKDGLYGNAGKDTWRDTIGEREVNVTVPATPEAAQWAGWGTALKPALEPICMARKPLSEGTVAANVLRWGTGAINVGACRVPAPEGLTSGGKPSGNNNPCFMSKDTDPRGERSNGDPAGRWPANLIHDGSEEVVGAFPETTSGSHKAYKQNVKGWKNSCDVNTFENVGDSGSAARFFYCAKASKADRAGSKHPTVKPIKLISYLLRMVTPPGGITLDPFAGSGTTGTAARLEGYRCIMIEREAEYVEDIRRRSFEPVQTCANF